MHHAGIVASKRTVTLLAYPSFLTYLPFLPSLHQYFHNHNFNSFCLNRLNLPLVLYSTSKKKKYCKPHFHCSINMD